MTKFIDYIDLRDKSLLVKKETANDFFEKIEEENIEPESLLKCRIVKKGSEASERYKVGDLILISASLLRKVKYNDCPKDIFVIYNEDNIFAAIKE